MSAIRISEIEAAMAAHNNTDHFDAALYLTGWTDGVRLVVNKPDEMLSTVRSLLDTPTTIGEDYDIGVLDAVCAAVGATEYYELASLVN